MTDTVNRDDRFERALQLPPGLWPFLVAGYPDLDSTARLLTAISKLPIRGIEIGFPFSDPVADGPVIQQAFTAALANGVRVNEIFKMLQSIRNQISQPILAMVSASIVYRWGTGIFVERAKRAGLDGLIIPDISLEEAGELSRLTGAAGLRLCMLVAPTTSSSRATLIAEAASGFLYYVAVQGTTGQRDHLPDELAKSVSQLRESTHKRVVVGFGISRPQHVRDVCRLADGAIVGSALVQALTNLLKSGATKDHIVNEISRMTSELCGT